MPYPLKSSLKPEDIITEGIMLIVTIIFLVSVWKIYIAYGREKAWKASLIGISIYSVGVMLDFLDEFYRLPQIIPRLIENILVALGLSVMAFGLVFVMRWLAKIGNTDVTTGVYNKVYLKKALDIEIERAKRYRLPLSVLFIDFNDFKKVNDQMGHATGDLVLRTMAGTVQGAVRRIDIVARYGGDEFILVLPHCDRCCAEKLFNRLKEAIAKTGFPGGCRIGISGGIAEYPADGNNADQLIDAADRRMYGNKRPCTAKTDDTEKEF